MGYDYDDYEEDVYTRTCGWCGKGNLAWADVKGKYRLVDEYGELHDCIEYYKNNYGKKRSNVVQRKYKTLKEANKYQKSDYNREDEEAKKNTAAAQKWIDEIKETYKVIEKVPTKKIIAKFFDDQKDYYDELEEQEKPKGKESDYYVPKKTVEVVKLKDLPKWPPWKKANEYYNTENEEDKLIIDEPDDISNIIFGAKTKTFKEDEPKKKIKSRIIEPKEPEPPKLPKVKSRIIDL